LGDGSYDAIHYGLIRIDFRIYVVTIHRGGRRLRLTRWEQGKRGNQYSEGTPAEQFGASGGIHCGEGANRTHEFVNPVLGTKPSTV
jgi:hypothetical protein